MIVAVADTHAALWFLVNDLRLSPQARRLMEDAIATGDKIAISAVSLVELVYLVEKGRLPQGAYDDLRSAVTDPNHVFTEAVVSSTFVRRCVSYPVPKCPTCPTASSLPQPFISAYQS